jgi:outer membrane protein
MRTKQGVLWGAFLILLVVSIPDAWAAETIKPLSLAESIDMAMKQSVLIHAAKEGVRGAEAQQKEAFTGFLPKFSTSYGYTRLNEDPYFVFPGVPPLIPAGNIITGTKDNYNWNVEARQPLFAGGGILANYGASRLGADIARMDEVATVQDLVQDVKVSYFNILKTARILAVAKQSVEQLKAHRDMAQGFFDVGIIPRNDLLYAEVELANGRQFLLRAENGVEIQHDPQAGYRLPGGDRRYT